LGNNKKINNKQKLPENDDSMASVYEYLAKQGLRPASNGIIRINNCNNSVRFEDRNGNFTNGKLDSKGQFVPFNKGDVRANKGDVRTRKINNEQYESDLSDVESQFLKSQYKMLCNGDIEDIQAALQASDPKILVGACVAAAEFNLDVNDRLLDLLNHENDLVSQSARKGLLIQSFYLLSKIKRVQSSNNDYFRGKPTPENLLRFTNGKKLEIGKDYVDFGPLPSDDNLAINSSINRWQIWFKRNESKFANMIKDTIKNYFKKNYKEKLHNSCVFIP